MTQKYIKTPIPEEISDKGGATIQFVERQTVPLETSVREAIDGLYVLGQEELVKSNFFGLMQSASDGIRRDGHARQIGDHITIYPAVTGEIDLDRGWNPAVNGVRIIARLLNELELDISNWSFEDVTPGKQSFKLNTVSTLGVEGIAEVGKVIALNGSGLPKTDAIRVGWAVEGTDKSGTIPAAKVTSNDVRANVAADALSELASDEYDGKTIVFTVRGNFSSAKISATLKYVAPHYPATSADGTTTVTGFCDSDGEEVEFVTDGIVDFVGTGLGRITENGQWRESADAEWKSAMIGVPPEEDEPLGFALQGQAAPGEYPNAEFKLPHPSGDMIVPFGYKREP